MAVQHTARLYTSQCVTLNNNMSPTHYGPGQHTALNPGAKSEVVIYIKK